MKKVLVVDHAKCTGCRLCEMVCSVKHTGMSNPGRSRIHVIKWPMAGLELPMLCQQCEDAPCVAICPQDALSRDPGLDRVVLDYDLCIGCKMCVTACPFGGMGLDTEAREVIKCDLCDGDPACVRFCEPGALEYVAATVANLRKKRNTGEKLAAVLGQSVTIKVY